MICFRCDRCGRMMTNNDPARYILRMEVYAAATHVDLDETEATGQSVADIVEQLARCDPDDVEDRTYRQIRLDLCDDCRKIILADPLGLRRDGTAKP